MGVRRAGALGAAIAFLIGLVGTTVHDGQTTDLAQPGTREWVRDSGYGEVLPAPGADPAVVAQALAQLDPDAQANLAATYPAVVGNLDGVPPQLRYAANRERAIAAGRPDLAAPGRQLFALDPRGRGFAVEVLGDLSSAQRVAVVVPGSDVDLDHFAGPDRPLGMAQAVKAEMDAAAAGVPTAVIAWAGYVTPVGIGVDAITGDLAEAGAERLSRFVEGLTAYTSAPITVLCHSYGSVVCGLAAPDLPVSNIVAFGSPGMRADSVADLHTDATVWAVQLADGDWIRYVPKIRFLGIGHGQDPLAPAFGAPVLASDGASGHTGYLAPGTASLRNLALVSLGDYSDLTCADGRTCHSALV